MGTPDIARESLDKLYNRDLFEKNEHWYGDGDLNKQDIAEFTAKYKNEIQASKNPRPNNSSSDGKASSKTVDNYDNSKSIAIDTANNESITKAEMDKQNSDADNKEYAILTNEIYKCCYRQ